MHGGARALAASDADSSEPSAEESLAHAEPIPPQVCLDALYRAESPRLLRLIARRAGRDEAGDLVHEIFYRIARLGGGGALRLDRPQAYLSRMATNLLRDRAKRAARQMSDRHIPADEGRLAGPDQQRLLETRDMLTRVEAAMLKLPSKTREIFMAHRIDGLSYAEIAECMGLSVKGVEKQMSKAIAMIDRLMDRG